MTQTGTQKIVNKAKRWWKHGKHQGTFGYVAQLNREQQHVRPTEMVGSLKELFGARRRP